MTTSPMSAPDAEATAAGDGLLELTWQIARRAIVAREKAIFAARDAIRASGAPGGTVHVYEWFEDGALQISVVPVTEQEPGVRTVRHGYGIRPEC